MEKMKNVWKRIGCICFSLLVFFALIFSAFLTTFFTSDSQLTVSADEATETVDKRNSRKPIDENNIWQWKMGAAMAKVLSDTDGAPIDTLLKFTAYLRDLNYYRDFIKKAKSQMMTTFTLYRESVAENNESVAMYEMIVLSRGLEDSIVTYLCHRSLYADGTSSDIFIDFFPAIRETSYLSADKDKNHEYFISAAESVKTALDAELDYVYFTPYGEESEPLSFFISEAEPYPYLAFVICPESNKTDYSIGIDYTYKTYEGKVWKNPFQKVDSYDVVKGSCRSWIRSRFYILDAIYQQDMLEDEFGEYAEEALEMLVSCYEPETVKVKYLVEIKGTPFARAVTKEITVPVLHGQIFYDDVCVALGVKSLSVLGANWEGFSYSESELCYITRYLESVYLVSRTTDGNTTDAGSAAGAKYFLDVNSSFRNYFYGFVENGVFTLEVYQFFLNKVKKVDPLLEGIPDYELHGHFGYVVIPEAYSFNSAWADLFDTKTNSVGVTGKFDYKNSLTSSAYDKLLQEYQYSWLERAWSSVAGGVTGEHPATHYLFYTSGENDRGGILENGATDLDDADGVAMNDVQEFAGDVGSGVASFAAKLAGGLGGVFSKFGNVVAIVGGIALVVVGVFFLFKYVRRWR